MRMVVMVVVGFLRGMVVVVVVFVADACRGAGPFQRAFCRARMFSKIEVV
jgi:hypothetical protein